MKSTLIGIDLAKNVFQVCALNRAGKVMLNEAVKRPKLLHFIRQFEPTTIAMESCGSSHHWARCFRDLGHTVELIPAQHVAPFVRGGKSDARDALAICEAAQRPSLHRVPIKSLEQQDLQAMHRLRQLYVEQTTATANQIRGIAREYGVCFSVGLRPLIKQVPEALESADNELTDIARALLAERLMDLSKLRERVLSVTRRIVQVSSAHPAFEALQALPGIGILSASAYLNAIGSGEQFKCGRQVSAWLGLVPRQYGSGGQLQLKGITKSGDRYLRGLLIHGARAAISVTKDRESPLIRWAEPIVARRGFNKAVVALANKNARIGWLIVARDATYDSSKAFAPA